MPPKVPFLFDYASPFSYVASVRLDRGALDAEPVYEPIYLRGLELFATQMPYSGAKLQYLMRDLQRITAHHEIALSPPASFPVNGLYALRGALVALSSELFLGYHRRAFAAIWAEGRDLQDAESVATLAQEVGFDRDEFLEKMSEPARKAELKQRTDRAAERGVFGVPTFFVGDELFWGHDRIEYVARALAAR